MTESIFTVESKVLFKLSYILLHRGRRLAPKVLHPPSVRCCENRLRSGITSSRVVGIVIDCYYDYGNDRV